MKHVPYYRFLIIDFQLNNNFSSVTSWVIIDYILELKECDTIFDLQQVFVNWMNLNVDSSNRPASRLINWWVTLISRVNDYCFLTLLDTAPLVWPILIRQLSRETFLKKAELALFVFMIRLCDQGTEIWFSRYERVFVVDGSAGGLRVGRDI